MPTSPQKLVTGDSLFAGSKVLDGGGVDFSISSILSQIGVRFLYLLEGVAILMIGFLLIRLIRSYFVKIETTHESQRMALNLLEKLISGFLVVVTITLALKVIGLDLTLLVSAVMLGLSFGLQDIIKDYISGILILFKSPFAIGDVVQVKSFIGKVERIDFQSTTLKTYDRREITIYNKDILSQSITNYTKEGMRRILLKVTLGRGSDTMRAIAIFEKILESHPEVLKDPKASIIFDRFQSQGLDLHVRFWVKRPSNILKIRSEIALMIERSFDEQIVFGPYAKTVQLGTDFTMNEGRLQRLTAFSQLPLMAGIAEKTLGQIGQVMSDSTSVDIDEPELEEVVG